MTSIETCTLSLNQKIESLSRRLRIEDPDNELLYFSNVFLTDSWSPEISSQYGRKFGGGFGTTFMQADINFCKALEAALL